MTEAFTVNALASRWNLPAGKVRAFIASGQLDAIDVSLNPGTGKPRYRVLADAVERFEMARTTTKTAPTPLRRRRAKQDSVTEFFK